MLKRQVDAILAGDRSHATPGLAGARSSIGGKQSGDYWRRA